LFNLKIPLRQSGIFISGFYFITFAFKQFNWSGKPMPNSFTNLLGLILKHSAAFDQTQNLKK